MNSAGQQRTGKCLRDLGVGGSERGGFREMTFEPHPQCEGEMPNLEGLGQRGPRSREVGPVQGAVRSAASFWEAGKR